ncbi:unnamed protein product, partial [marine sediment metagenome]
GRWSGVTYVAGGNVVCESDAAPTTNWESVVFTRDGILNEIFVDGAVQADTENLGGAIDSTSLFHIGQHNSGAVRFDGKLDEIRFSDSARNDAWVKASYYSGADDLLTWGTEETAPVGAPTVVSFAATSVEETTATVSGNVTAVNDGNIKQRGFVWGTTCNATMPANTEPPPASYDFFWVESDNWTTGVFTHNLTGLTPGECYCWRATANNTLGLWGYSAEDVFHTKPQAPTNLVCTPSV